MVVCAVRREPVSVQIPCLPPKNSEFLQKKGMYDARRPRKERSCNGLWLNSLRE